MVNIKEQATTWLSEAMEGTPFFLLDVTLNERRLHLTVQIDGDQGVPIGQCVELTRMLNEKLEETFGEEHPYSLEVSSPGADSLLKMLRQYPQHIGRDLDITLQDGSKTSGKLKAIEGETLTIVQNQKEKTRNLGKEQVVVFPDIKEANVILKFK